MTTTVPASVRTSASRPRLSVASDQPLVAQSVRVALVDRGYEVSVARWPRPGEAGDAPTGRSWPRAVREDPAHDVLVVVCDLDRRATIRSACRLLTRVDAPCVVLCGACPGPGWGAVLAAGAAAVVSSGTTIDTLTGLLTDVARGREGPPWGQRRDLVRAWRRAEARRVAVENGVAALTARESEVLRLLHAGECVRDIATRLHTTEATVRTQVKAVLRKLGVGSQLAAVAAYEALRDP